MNSQILDTNIQLENKRILLVPFENQKNQELREIIFDKGIWKFMSLIILCLFTFNVTTVNAQFPSFKDGDTVCFVGNSITMNARFYNYLELFYATRFPERTIEFHNCGISGDVAGGVLGRMESDILILKPTWAVLMLGMNDVGRSLYAPSAEEGPEQDKKRNDALARYYLRTDSIVRLLLDEGIKVALQTPTIYDQTAKIPMENNVGANDALRQCADFLEATAKKYDLPIVDYWNPMIKINERLQQEDATATIIGSDRVHPGAVGHFLMTCEFLRSQQPSDLVSSCQIDAKKSTVLKATQCKIDNVKSDKNALLFSMLDSAFPLPKLEKDFDLDSLLDFTNEFNSQILKVKSLRKGNYSLHIDDENIGHFTNKEFRKGVNLTRYPQVPQNQQAMAILDLFNQYWGLEHRLRRLQYVELKLLHMNSQKTYSVDEIESRFAAKMEQVKGGSQSAINFYNRSFKAYLKDKPEENKMQEEAKELFQQIQNKRTPVSHHFSISRIT